MTARDSLLAVIDVQRDFLAKLPAADPGGVVERMRGADVAVLGAKNLHYEWVPSVALAYALERQVLALGLPDAVIL
jgi:hypothetical protein